MIKDTRTKKEIHQLKKEGATMEYIMEKTDSTLQEIATILSQPVDGLTYKERLADIKPPLMRDGFGNII